MINISHISKSFKSGDTKVEAIKDINFEVPEGAFASIIGKSGSGKSTLLALLGALDRPTSGTITVDGKDVTDMGDHALIAYRCQKIGFVFQSYNLIPNLSAQENVMLPMEFAHVPAKERKARAKTLLDQVGIMGDKQLRKPARLSGGEQQRVSIARALANKPSLILADEPTGNLDTATGKMVFDLLHSLSRSQKTTIIVVTHDLSIAGKTDMTFRLQDGQLV
ncbi:MAG TPA: ABC transporter ATP-binding protein [Patescibacteria group bacterium]|jgi:putative ABC transport system ATP-binding protein|nr:ABC transporter ATP-binding protein [Patescibacteria group bacterium]